MDHVTNIRQSISQLLASQMQGVLGTSSPNGDVALHLMAYAFTPSLCDIYLASFEDTLKVTNMLHNPRVSWLWDNRTGNQQDHIEGFALNAVGLATQVVGKEHLAAAELLLDRNASLSAMLADTRAVIFAVDVERYSWIQGYSEVRDYLPGAAE